MRGCKVSWGRRLLGDVWPGLAIRTALALAGPTAGSLLGLPARGEPLEDGVERRELVRKRPELGVR